MSPVTLFGKDRPVTEFVRIPFAIAYSGAHLIVKFGKKASIMEIQFCLLYIIDRTRLQEKNLESPPEPEYHSKVGDHTTAHASISISHSGLASLFTSTIVLVG